jgi:hypothetical protein
MKSLIAKCLCVVCFLAIVLFASGVRAQGPYEEGPGQEQGQAPPRQGPVQQQEQAPPKEEKSTAKEFGKVFCAESSSAQKYMIVNNVNCTDICDNLYREYPCDLQQRLSDGWKVTSVSVSTITVERDPCECGLTGTESVLERTK